MASRRRPVPRAFLLALALGLTACEEPPAPLTPDLAPPAPSFADGATYMAVILDGPDADLGLNAMCDVTETRRYRLRYDRLNWPTCSAHELLLGAPDPSRPLGAGYGEAALPDGRVLQVWRLIDTAAGPGAEPLPGRYTLAVRSLTLNTIEPQTGRIPVYDITPGAIHYLGEIDGEDRVAGRHVAAFAATFRRLFPDVPPARLALGPTGALDADCAPFTPLGGGDPLGFDCEAIPADGPAF